MTPVRKTLDRIRSKRQEEESGENTPVDQTKSNSRRKEALNKLRNSGSKSKPNEEKVKKRPPPEEIIEEKDSGGGPLTTILHPVHIYPLDILPTLRQTESQAQPLLYTPYPSPYIPWDIPNLFTRPPSNNIKREGTWEIEHNISNSNSTPSESTTEEKKEKRGVRLRKKKDRSKDTENSTENPNSTHKEEDDEESEPLLPSEQAEHISYLQPSPVLELMSPIRRTEGLYSGEVPVVTQLLLRSEPVDAPISPLVSSGIYLSRCTQRLLRDGVAQHSVLILRQLWQALQTIPVHDDREITLPSSLTSALEKIHIPPSLTQFSKETNQRNCSDIWLQILEYSQQISGSKDRPCGLSVLLRSEKFSEPTLRLLENWIDQRTQQQTHPVTTRKLLFGENQELIASMKSEYIGHIFDGLGGRAAQERKGFTLKIAAQEITLSNHPYMSEEEVTYVSLKRLYSQYSRHLRSKAYEYLPYRVLALIAELRAVVHPFNTISQDISPTEYENLIDRLYCDLLETLPVLCEYKATLEDLGNSVYSTWRNIIDIRRKQGFVSTRVMLIAKNIQFSQSPQSEDGDGGEDEEKGNDPLNQNYIASRYWDELLTQINTLPDLMKMAFEKSHPPNMETHPNILNSSMTLGSEVAGASTPIKRTSSIPPSSAVNKAQIQQPLQHAKALEMIESAVEYLLESTHGKLKDRSNQSRSSMLPPIVYRLTNSGSISPDDQVPMEEIERRNKLKRVSIRLMLKVHGQIVAVSGNYKLQWPELKVDIDQLYELRVLRHPSDVVFDIFVSYELKSSWLSCFQSVLAHETLVATVGVPLSQRISQSKKNDNLSGLVLPTLCYSPVVGWYEFASQHLMDASHGRGLVYANNKLTSNLSTIRLSGALLCGSEYDLAYDPSGNSITINNTLEGVFSQDIAYIPPSDQTNYGRIVGGRLEFTQEKDFFDLLPPLKLLDIHDPRNDDLMRHKIRGLLSGRMRKRNIFQLGGEYFTSLHGEEGMTYGNYLKYQPSNRLRLLRLRELKPYLFTEGIPLSEELIKSSELFKKILINEQKAQANTGQYMVDYLRDNPPSVDGGVISENLEGDEEEESAGLGSDLHTRNALRANTFLTRVRDSQIVLSRQARKKKVVTSSVVHEVLEPLNDWDLFGLFGSLGLPERKRALKPKPVERTPEAIPKKCDLMVQIVSARNVPLRVKLGSDANKIKKPTGGFGNSRNKSRRGNNDEDDQEFLLDDQDDEIMEDKKRVNTFVEITFQENKVRTTSVEGPAPVWKQSLSLPFNPPHGEFNHATLEQVTDVVTFTLFDAIVFDDASRGGYLDGENTKREERFYLGSFSIPFATILAEKRIEGTFRLDTPSFNYGYVAPGATPRRSSHREIPEPVPGGILGLFGFGTSQRRREEQEQNLLNEQFIPEKLVNELDWHCTTPTTTTHLTIMVTLDPLLISSPFVDSDVTISTTYPPDRPLVTYAQLWLQIIRDLGVHTKKRKYTLFGSNSDGLSVLICRYLKPLTPPPGVTSRRGCIHTVSLIPFIPDSQAFVGEFDLWCTATQTWQIMGGDEEEHATILYNYLYYLSLKSRENGQNKSRDDGKDRFYLGYPSEEYVRNEELFLVLGQAIPEGNTVYVLMRTPQSLSPSSSTQKSSQNSLDNSPTGWVLINPCTGHIYSAADPHCPLSDITCLATPYNIWTNIQKASKPKDLSFDIFKLSHWRPLFGQRFRPNISSLSSIQNEIPYEPTNQALCLEIEKILKNEIKSSLRKWRSKRAKPVTTFHPDASAIMTDMLTYLEEWKMNGTVDGNSLLIGEESGVGQNPPSVSDGGRQSNLSATRVKLSSNSSSISRQVIRMIEEKATSRLKNILHSNVLRGYPINMPYTDVASVLTKIQLCCLHETKHPDVLFVLSVRCFPLYNGLFSLWLFLGTLEKERS